MKKVLSLIILILISSNNVSAGRTFEAIQGDISSLDDPSLTEYILIDFFATWCVPCQISMPELVEVYDILDSKVSMLSISMDTMEDKSDILDFIDEFNSTWIFGWDSTGELNQSYNVFYYPTTVILDKDRTVIKEWTGITTADTILKELDKYVSLDGRFSRNPQIFVLTGMGIFFVLIIIQIVKIRKNNIARI